MSADYLRVDTSMQALLSIYHLPSVCIISTSFRVVIVNLMSCANNMYVYILYVVRQSILFRQSSDEACHGQVTDVKQQKGV